MRLPAFIKNAVEKSLIEADRRKVLNEVIASEAMLRQSERLAHIGSWQSDLISKTDNWSDETFHLYGYKPGEVKPCFSLFINHVHHEDFEEVKKGLASALLNLDDYEHQFRVVDREGKIKHVRAN
jgi:hypothetical protein